MKKAWLLCWVCLLVAACSTGASEPANGGGGDEGTSAESGSEATAVPAVNPPETAEETQPELDIPTGTIYAIEITSEAQNLVQIDVATAVKQTIFSVPENGWLTAADYSPERDQFVWAYAPPPPEGKIQFGFTNLYLWQIGEESPTLLVEPESESNVFFNPVWAADGETIYYSHIEPIDIEEYTFTTTLKRLHLATNEIEDIAENGIWPSLSANGQKLAYIVIRDENSENALVISDPEGGNVTELLDFTIFDAIDVPIFSPDGTYLYFSAAEFEVQSRPLWEIILGIQVAAAHNLPSDWYRLPVMGGDVERLTEIEAVGLYGRFAANDAPFFAFASQNGLYTMSPDGGNLEILVDGSFSASLSWVP